MYKEMKQTFQSELEQYAKANIIKKLQKQELDYTLLKDAEFNSLVLDEIEILKTDSKKVGAGIGIGILISLVTGI
ncbi:hypothetical protein JHD49_09290 [Sulfurimonas sp. SAG-AH-194-C21]|nr:hypothetical protein [Sulfurimonas sp. SAG-AH-194-C21]MDF1884132.1 hypothetical protein [Sulfurimonas sp. SAG-AH-194-C21]